MSALFMCLGLGYIFNFLGVFLDVFFSIFTGVPATDMNPVMDALDELTPGMVIYTCLIAPFMEEFIFRGVLLKKARRFGDRTAVVFCASHGSEFLFHDVSAGGKWIERTGDGRNGGGVFCGKLHYDPASHRSRDLLFLPGRTTLLVADGTPERVADTVQEVCVPESGIYFIYDHFRD